MITGRPRVLISAFSCNPLKGSEPGLGFNYVRQLAEHCDLAVITEELKNRSAIEDAQRQIPVLERVQWHYIPWPCVTRDGHCRTDVNFVHYYHIYREWQRRAYALGKSLIASGTFDLVHHLTMTGYREPGYLWKSPLPFVWGPVGGHVMMPGQFLNTLGVRGMVQCATRNVLNALQMRYSRRVAQATRKASAILASTSIDVEAIRRYHGRTAVLIGENGSGTVESDRVRERNPNQVLKLVWSGIHVPRKALHLLLPALALLPNDVAVELHVLGDGPERHRWENLAIRLGVRKMCHFHGWVARTEALRLMKSTDALVITSLQDACSAVLFEALAAGLPVVSHAACGFVDVVTKDCGLLVAVESPATSAREIAGAVSRLFRHPNLYRRLSAGAIARAHELSWKNRAALILQAYKQVIQRSRHS